MEDRKNKLTVEYKKWLERKIKVKDGLILIFLRERFGEDHKQTRLEHYLNLIKPENICL